MVIRRFRAGITAPSQESVAARIVMHFRNIKIIVNRDAPDENAKLTKTAMDELYAGYLANILKALLTRDGSQPVSQALEILKKDTNFLAEISKGPHMSESDNEALENTVGELIRLYQLSYSAKELIAFLGPQTPTGDTLAADAETPKLK